MLRDDTSYLKRILKNADPYSETLASKVLFQNFAFDVKSALSGVTHFLATESPSKLMKNAYFTLQTFFVLKILKFFSQEAMAIRQWNFIS